MGRGWGEGFGGKWKGGAGKGRQTGQNGLIRYKWACLVIRGVIVHAVLLRLST